MASTAQVPGFHLVRLQAWMDRAGLGHGPLAEVVRLTGGTQNVMMRFSRDGRD